MIFVEGNDDKNFLVSLLNDLKNSNEITLEEQVNFQNYIEVMGSKKKLLDVTNDKYLKNSMKILKGDIQKVLFIFDCDFVEDDNQCNGMENTQKCYDSLIKELDWDVPSECHIFDKNLDYFLVDTIKDKECYSSFDDLVKCLEVENVKPNKKPIANLYRDLYPYPKFDFKDSNFNELKQKLKNLFEE